MSTNQRTVKHIPTTSQTGWVHSLCYPTTTENLVTKDRDEEGIHVNCKAEELCPACVNRVYKNTTYPIIAVDGIVQIPSNDPDANVTALPLPTIHKKDMEQIQGLLGKSRIHFSKAQAISEILFSKWGRQQVECERSIHGGFSIILRTWDDGEVTEVISEDSIPMLMEVAFNRFGYSVTKSDNKWTLERNISVLSPILVPFQLTENEVKSFDFKIDKTLTSKDLESLVQRWLNGHARFQLKNIVTESELGGYQLRIYRKGQVHHSQRCLSASSMIELAQKFLSLGGMTITKQNSTYTITHDITECVKTHSEPFFLGEAKIKEIATTFIPGQYQVINHEKTDRDPESWTLKNMSLKGHDRQVTWQADKRFLVEEIINQFGFTLEVVDSVKDMFKMVPIQEEPMTHIAFRSKVKADQTVHTECGKQWGRKNINGKKAVRPESDVFNMLPSDETSIWGYDNKQEVCQPETTCPDCIQAYEEKHNTKLVFKFIPFPTFCLPSWREKDQVVDGETKYSGWDNEASLCGCSESETTIGSLASFDGMLNIDSSKGQVCVDCLKVYFEKFPTWTLETLSGDWNKDNFETFLAEQSDSDPEDDPTPPSGGGQPLEKQVPHIPHATLPLGLCGMNPIDNENMEWVEHDVFKSSQEEVILVNIFHKPEDICQDCRSATIPDENKVKYMFKGGYSNKTLLSTDWSNVINQLKSDPFNCPALLHISKKIKFQIIQDLKMTEPVPDVFRSITLLDIEWGIIDHIHQVDTAIDLSSEFPPINLNQVAVQPWDKLELVQTILNQDYSDFRFEEKKGVKVRILSKWALNAILNTLFDNVKMEQVHEWDKWFASFNDSPFSKRELIEADSEVLLEKALTLAGMTLSLNEWEVTWSSRNTARSCVHNFLIVHEPEFLHESGEVQELFFPTLKHWERIINMLSPGWSIQYTQPSFPEKPTAIHSVERGMVWRLKDNETFNGLMNRWLADLGFHYLPHSREFIDLDSANVQSYEKNKPEQPTPDQKHIFFNVDDKEKRFQIACSPKIIGKYQTIGELIDQNKTLPFYFTDLNNWFDKKKDCPLCFHKVLLGCHELHRLGTLPISNYLPHQSLTKQIINI